MTIKRYEVRGDVSDEAIFLDIAIPDFLEEHPCGPWVKYDDHVAELELELAKATRVSMDSRTDDIFDVLSRMRRTK